MDKSIFICEKCVIETFYIDYLYKKCYNTGN